MKIQTEIWMGYEVFGENIIFPSAPVPGINNDQFLIHVVSICTQHLPLDIQLYG